MKFITCCIMMTVGAMLLSHDTKQYLGMALIANAFLISLYRDSLEHK